MAAHGRTRTSAYDGNCCHRAGPTTKAGGPRCEGHARVGRSKEHVKRHTLASNTQQSHELSLILSSSPSAVERIRIERARLRPTQCCPTGRVGQDAASSPDRVPAWSRTGDIEVLLEPFLEPAVHFLAVHEGPATEDVAQKARRQFALAGEIAWGTFLEYRLLR